MVIRLPDDVEFILQRLKSYGSVGYIVGGCVRDYMLGKEPDDWDSNYTSYYTKSGEDYVPVPAGSGTAPAFAQDTYYKKESL